MADVPTIAQISAATSSATFGVVLIWFIRTWPYWKARVNEARKIQLDADSALRTDLLRRIRDLEETQSADRLAFNTALSDERRRCDAELDAIRKRLRVSEEENRARLLASEEENRGLRATISQNSQSTAQLMSRPDAIATSKAKRND